MNAIQVTPNGLEWLSTADPQPQNEEVIVQVRAAGVNRADLLQASGNYPPPSGVTDILGLELAGLAENRRVCCLVPGGAYAEKVAVHRSMLLPIPDDWSFSKAAAIPEAWLTAFVNLFMEGHLATGESVLIHAGASGVGLAAIQMAREAGAHVYATVRTSSKVAFCESFGATVVDPTGPFPDADVILDCVGGSYLPKNIQALKRFGRLISIGLLGGPKGELNMATVLRNRLRIIGSTLRSRTRPEQIEMTAQFQLRFWKNFLDGTFATTIDREFPIQQAGDAHRYMADNRNVGKIILTVPQS